jgi:hypothetical protein
MQVCIMNQERPCECGIQSADQANAHSHSSIKAVLVGCWRLHQNCACYHVALRVHNGVPKKFQEFVLIYNHSP